MSDRVLYDSHMHTPLCHHAVGDTEDYAAAGLARGLKGIIFTCHSPMPRGWWPQVRMDDDDFDDYVDMVGRAERVFAGQIEVKLGLESDWFPGLEGWIEKLHRRAGFHHILGSVHFFGPEYMQKFYVEGEDLAFRRLYFQHLAESAESGLFDTLAHPDLVKNFRHSSWNFEEIRDDLAGALDRIAKTGVAMEINTSGLQKKMPEMNPGLEMLKMMCERGIPVVLGSDAHRWTRVSADFEDALDSVEAAGYRSVSYFDRRQRREIPIVAARASLVEPALA